jgi:hypothetical protein
MARCSALNPLHDRSSNLASIRRCSDSGEGPSNSSPGRLTDSCQSVMALIQPVVNRLRQSPDKWVSEKSTRGKRAFADPFLIHREASWYCLT